VRLDSGFYRTDLLADCRARGARFSVSVPRSSAMWAALERIEEHDWAPAEGMERAEVAETGYRPAGWAAEELRLIVRRVAHSASELSEDPRARRRRTIPQEQLAMGIEGRADPVYGYSFVLTDRAGSTTCVERHHRERARVEGASRTRSSASRCAICPSRTSRPTASGSIRRRSRHTSAP